MNPKYRGKTPEEILKMLTLEEKARQVIVPSENAYTQAHLEVDPTTHNVSFLCDSEQEYETLRKRHEFIRKNADIPELFGVDMETGLGQTVHVRELATEFAEQMALGAIADIEDAKRLAYLEGKQIASEGSKLGWNVVFGPVVDVNNNPENPITNIRSVGETPELVAEITSAMIRGIQEDHRMIALAKHFPGAGMSAVDSHFGLEEQSVNMKEMEEVHLVPFQRAIDAGVMGMMCNHAIYPIDPDSIATLSRPTMTGLLREKMGFQGIMYTDAMAMAGLQEEAKRRHVSSTVLAINAGIDMLLGPDEGEGAVDVLVNAVKNGDLPESRLDDSCLRVLKAKAWLGLFDEKEPEPLPIADGWALANEISRKSITVLKTKGLVPFDFRNKKVLVIEPTHPAARLSFGLATNMTLIKDILAKDVPQAELVKFHPDITDEEREEIVKKAKDADVILAGTSFRSRSGQVGMLSLPQLEALHAVGQVNKNLICIVSNPYVTAQLDFVDEVICCYSTSQCAVEAAVNVVLGREKALGVKRVTIPKRLKNAVTIVAH